MGFIRSSCILITLLSLAAMTCPGQGLTGQITGNVTDPSGSAIVGAEVKLTNIETTQVRLAATNASGDFVFTQLLRGQYRLEVTAKGFKRFERSQVELTASERVVLPTVVLELGELTQTVTINDEAARIQTQSAERSGLISSQQTQNIALKGRDYLGLLKLLPGVVDTAARLAPGWNNLVGMTINGNREGTVNLTLDGVSSLDTGSMTGPYLAPSIDAVAEMKVLLTNYQAEYGRSSGGTINTVIKSGTRDFHGGAYYFLRNEALNANEFFRNRDGLAKPLYRFNYPGYFIGGPVTIPGKFNTNRDKLFFFWSQEFLPRTRPTSLARRTFPSQLERNGDFSQTVDANGRMITINDPFNKNAAGQAIAFPDNKIPGSRIDAAGQKLLNVFPVPGAMDSSNTFNSVFQSTVDQPRREEILRVDWNIGSKTTFYARAIQDYEAFKGEFEFTLASSSWPQLPMKYEIFGKGLVATLIHTFTPTLVNEFTFGVNRARQFVGPLDQAGLDRNIRSKIGLNLPQYYPQSNPMDLIPNANFGGVQNAPQLNIEQRYPFFGTNNIWNYNDNLSWIKGAHNMKFGVYIEQTSRNAQRSTAFNGTFDFGRNVNNPLDTNYAYANAMLGTFYSYTEANGHPHAHSRYFNVEWYAQDQWKVARHFTLDFGMRFYLIQPTWSAGDNLSMFDSELYDRTKQPSLVQPYLDNGVRVGRDPVTGAILPATLIGTYSSNGTPYQGMNVFSEKIMETPSIQVAPRFGFAWDVFGNGNTAVRGGFGIFYDRFNDDQILQLVEAPPNVITGTTYFSTISDLLSTPAALNPPGVFSIQRDYDPPTAYNWSFGIQQNLGWKTVLDVAYVGNVGRHLLHRRSLNATNYGTNFLASSIDPTTGNTPLPTNFLRPNTGYADIQYIEMASTSNYHSMQTQVNRRFGNSLTFGTSWTWSKAMTLVNGNGDAINPYLDYRMRNYGKASFDRTHNLVFNWIYNLPKASSVWENGFSKWVLDNWDVSGMATFMSGAPSGLGYSLVQAQDLTGASGAGIDSRVVLVANPNLPKSERTIYRHFNTDAVRPPTRDGLGIGNAPKDPIRGPGQQVWDVSLFKNIPFDTDGTKRLQLRFEFYNFFNHTNFTSMDTTGRFDTAGNQVNTRFGQYTNSADARRIVLGAKFYF